MWSAQEKLEERVTPRYLTVSHEGMGWPFKVTHGNQGDSFMIQLSKRGVIKCNIHINFCKDCYTKKLTEKANGSRQEFI